MFHICVSVASGLSGGLVRAALVAVAYVDANIIAVFCVYATLIVMSHTGCLCCRSGSFACQRIYYILHICKYKHFHLVGVKVFTFGPDEHVFGCL